MLEKMTVITDIIPSKKAVSSVQTLFLLDIFSENLK